MLVVYIFVIFFFVLLHICSFGVRSAQRLTPQPVYRITISAHTTGITSDDGLHQCIEFDYLLLGIYIIIRN